MAKIRGKYDEQLNELSASLLKMSMLATDAVSKAISALKADDKALMKQVINEDDDINHLERRIDQLGLNLLLRQQPVAKDLRKISATLKMITDIERIGDAASDISAIGLNMDNAIFSEFPELFSMAETARDMVSMAMDAYTSNSLDKALEVTKTDDIIDQHFVDILHKVSKIVSVKAGLSEQLINCIMIAKYLERIGDHAVNLCEWVEFYLTGIHKDERII